MLHDLRLALRQLARSPAFALLVVLSLAVGIGIHSTIFSAMDAAFLHPLSVRFNHAPGFHLTVETKIAHGHRHHRQAMSP